MLGKAAVLKDWAPLQYLYIRGRLETAVFNDRCYYYHIIYQRLAKARVLACLPACLHRYVSRFWLLIRAYNTRREATGPDTI